MRAPRRECCTDMKLRRQKSKEANLRLSLLGVDGTTLVDGFTDDVDDTSQAFRADRDENGGTGIDDLHASNQTFGTVCRKPISNVRQGIEMGD
jgi:hypothetical protein